ncbi:MAG: hypothetical protein A3J83_00795 [Elusimicrobia bacterium RIFOXYA2_FULL_40_6]|nr:MAG: hypothetical protein A3J83_00795 [Elusimicrobia bacterium RIFOXYA2_FULL_40_6]
MSQQKRFIVDVGMQNLPFPMKVVSRANKDGQATVANISINARIMQEFEAGWIDKFIEIVHKHRDRIGTRTLNENIKVYMKELKAEAVKIDFEYPFFIEKLTPKAKEKCLVKYNCVYSVKINAVDEKPKIYFKINVPIITTYPASEAAKQKGLFGQLSIVAVDLECKEDVYPEDIIELVDKHALAPVYSFLTKEDQDYIIDKIHSTEKSSVVTMDEIKDELAHNKNIEWYSVICSNFGMLHSYSTLIGTEKSMWIPFTSYE